MILTPAQSQIAIDDHRFRVVNCGRRFGKTTLATLEMLAKAVFKDDRRIVYIAPTYQQSRDIAWQELKKLAAPIEVSINESRLEIVVRTTEGGVSKLMLRGWESIDTLRGQLFDFIVLDEVASYRNFFMHWQEVLRPTLTDRKGHALFISTPKGFNHFFDLYNLEKEDEDYKSFHFSSYDNPHLPVEELEKAQDQMTEDRFAQEYLADFRKTEGLVYKEFDRDRHVYNGASKNLTCVQKIVGLDWGYTNPTGVLFIEKDTDDHYWISEEYYQKGKTAEETTEYISTYPIDLVYPDPAEPDRNSVLLKAGLRVMEVNKSVTAGIDAVRELFKANRIHIHQNCVNLIAELDTYSYKPKKADKNSPEEPIKENDHLVDALRYALFMNSSRKKKKENTQYIPNYLNHGYNKNSNRYSRSGSQQGRQDSFQPLR
jgi:PBSX family phage terminase large subunit